MLAAAVQSSYWRHGKRRDDSGALPVHLCPILGIPDLSTHRETGQLQINIPRWCLEHLQNHWGFTRKLFTDKNPSGAPWKHKYPVYNLVPDNSLQHKPAMNCYKPLGKGNWNCSISQIWRDSLCVLAAGLEYAVFLQSRKCFSGTWEQTWPIYSTCAWNSQASLSYTFSFPPNCSSYSK